MKYAERAKDRRRVGFKVGCCVLAALLTSGCASSRASFSLTKERSDPVTAGPSESAGPWKVLVEAGDGLDLELRASLIRALGRNPSIRKVELGTVADAQANGFDYVLRFSVALAGEGEGLNFLRCFPGFLIGTPSWAPLTWRCDLHTDVQLTRARDLETLSPFARRDGVDMAFTSEGYATASYSGWWALVFTPSLAMPLATGIVSAFDSVPHDQFWRRFPRSKTCSRWADRVAGELVAHLAGDQEATAAGGG